MLAMAQAIAFSGQAAELKIDDRVVVRFGTDAQLIVRDKLTLGSSVTLTSEPDDAAGGTIGSTPGLATEPSWRGLRIEKSSQSWAATNLSGLTVRYAGVGDTAAVSVRGNLTMVSGSAPKWRGMTLSHNAIGLRLLDGAAPSIQESSFLDNLTGIEAVGGSPAKVSNSQFVGNTAYAVNNLTPASVVVATGNWWGHASGPTNAAANPTGQGDAVSTGVNFGQSLAYAPLIDCTISPSAGYTSVSASVDIALHCVNATQYRLSETGDFSAVAYAPIVPSVTFQFSPGPGYKNLQAQFADAGGHTVTVAMPQAIAYDPGTPIIPTVTLTAPAEGAVLFASPTLAATATDSFGIAKVDFLVDGALVKSVAGNGPYGTVWDLTTVGNGSHSITAVATNTHSQTASDTHTVTVAKVQPGIASLLWAGMPLVAGTNVVGPGQLVATLDAPGGLKSVALSIDGTPVSGGSLSGSTYSVFLDFNAIPNGDHSITLTVSDKIGGVGQTTLNLTVAFPVPPAPTILVPVSGITAHQTTVTVSGTGVAGTQVQLYVDGQASGAPLLVKPNGSFSGVVTLLAEGSHTITAVDSGGHGTSATSPGVTIVYQIAAPTVSITSPSEGATVTASRAINVAVTDSSPISHVDLALDGTLLTSLTAAPYAYDWDVSAVGDGAHTITATAVNQAGKSGEATRHITLAKTPPPPPPVITPYTGSVNAITPAISYGDQPIQISGQALDRATNQPVANAGLKLILRVAGFQRSINLSTDGNGSFAYTFIPQATDAGSYLVSVIHPQETELTTQGQFTIDRLKFAPTVAKVSVARGFTQAFSIKATASAGNGATGVHFAVNPEDQPSGALPPGITIDTSASVNLAAGATASIPLSLTAGATAPAGGTLILTAYATGSGSAKRGYITINDLVYDPVPLLSAAPTQVQTGVAQGGSVTEVLNVTNKGLVAAQGLTAQLVTQNGAAAPAWIYLATAAQLGTLEAGAKQSIQVTAAPDGSVANGIYNFKVNVSAQNAPGGSIPIAVSVTQAGAGDMSFHVSDIYTETLDGQGVPIPGLAGATIKVQNADVLTVQKTATTDGEGVATVTALPPGNYVYRASARNHLDASGRFQVKPGVGGMQEVFLDNALVNVEFGVTETTIKDHYDVVVTATYQTQVPAAVVLVEPMSINIPDLQVGEEVTGELTITNYGLVRADNVVFTPPASDGYYTFEVYGSVPTSLEAKQRITLPYKIINTSALPSQATIVASASSDEAGLPKMTASASEKPSVTGDAGRVTSLLTARLRNALRGQQAPVATTAAASGGCLRYSSGYGVSCSYDCAAGDKRNCGSGGGFNRVYGTCGGGPSSGSWGGGGGGGGSGGGWRSGTLSSPSPMPMTPQCAPACNSCVCSAAGGGHGGS
jgi:hypothetical protein